MPAGDVTPSRKSTRLKIENQTLKDYAVEMPSAHSMASTIMVVSKSPVKAGRKAQVPTHLFISFFYNFQQIAIKEREVIALDTFFCSTPNFIKHSKVTGCSSKIHISRSSAEATAGVRSRRNWDRGRRQTVHHFIRQQEAALRRWTRGTQPGHTAADRWKWEGHSRPSAVWRSKVETAPSR